MTKIIAVSGDAAQVSKKIERSVRQSPIDLTGQTFGRLTALEPTKRQGKNKEQWWLCRCSCGNVCAKRSYRLRHGVVRSCGCIPTGSGCTRIPDRQLALKRHIYGKTKACAIKRGFVFELSLEEFWECAGNPCAYCGKVGVGQTSESKNDHGGMVHVETLRHNGVDRLDSDIGYIKSNVTGCCKHCNFAKAQMSLEEFKEWVDAVYHHIHQIV